ncbi:MAG TPA: hypothetical protein VHN20_05440 [Beijerinckiaceae bacterium]|nr:hypothetical protein [Beijerinckiaceae bacterium]
MVGFLNTARLELSFDKLKDFDVLNVNTYNTLGTSLKFDLETSEPMELLVFYNDVDEAKRLVRKSTVSLKNFKLNSRVQGHLVDDDLQKTKFNVTGYYNTERLVLSHRGPFGGLGIYVLEQRQLKDVDYPVFSGFVIMENQLSESARGTSLTQCPCVMVSASAPAKYTQVEVAEATYPFLTKGCSQISLPDLWQGASASAPSPG